MAIIKPFKGVLFNTEKIDRPGNVMSPPYDVISKGMQDDLYSTDPHNIVRIIFGKDRPSDSPRDNKYTRASKYLNEWLKSGVMRLDEKPALYVYSQEFHVKGRLYRRYGFIGLMKIEAARKRRVMPHEHTFSKPKEDRLNLLRSTSANTSCVFSIFQDDKKEVMRILKSSAKGKAYIDVEISGVRHRLWRLQDKASIQKIQRAMADKSVFIADGHHRYETAVNYREEIRKSKKGPSSADYVMMYFTSINDPGLTVLSTYRAVKDLGGMSFDDMMGRLGKHFDIAGAPDIDGMLKGVDADKKRYAFGLYVKGRGFKVLSLKDASISKAATTEKRSRAWKRLDVTMLHNVVLEHILDAREDRCGDDNIIYTRDEKEAVELVDSGKAAAVFFPRATKVREVRSVAKRGDRMPHKSTYFYPKLLTGLVVNKL